MVLEPPGLDPTIAPAAAIGEIVHYNVLEGLTKINVDGSVTPLLAESWIMDPDGKSYTFKLRKGVKFQDGEAFDASDVKFSFERAKAEGSTNKAKKAVFDNISSIATPDPHTVILTLNNADGNFLFRMGENTAVILRPEERRRRPRPSRSAPARSSSTDWDKGSAVTLVKWDGFRDAPSVKLNKVTFRFINDPAAQVAALLAGDIDGMPRFGAPQSLKQFQADQRFTVDDRRDRGQGHHDDQQQEEALRRRARAPRADACDRPQGLHRRRARRPRQADRQPLRADRRRLRRPDRVYPYDPEKAKALLKEAGVATPLNVTLTLPPPQYARKGGEVVAAQLAKVGVDREDRERRVGAVAVGHLQGQLRPDDHQPRRAAGLHAVRQHRLLLGLRQQGLPRPGGPARGTPNPKERTKLFGDMQRMLATDAVNAYIFNPAQVAVRRRG